MNTESLLKAEHRKLRKVVVERQRRDRIERCLEQLKTILLQSDNSLLQQHHQAGTKLEKAELLEMTVAYVCRVQNDVSRQMSFGFTSCMREVDAFLAQTGTGSEMDGHLRAHLVRRLSRCRRRLGPAVLSNRTGSRHCDEDQPTSSSTSISGSGLVPRKLCFDDAGQTRPALRDVNDNTRLTSDIYRRSATLTTGSENVDFLYGQQLDAVDFISSTTCSVAQPGRSVEISEGPSSSVRVDNVENIAEVFDYSNMWNVSNIKDESTSPVWRPW